MRKRQAKKRPLLPDPKFNDQLVTRFVNNLMWDGKKFAHVEWVELLSKSQCKFVQIEKFLWR